MTVLFFGFLVARYVETLSHRLRVKVICPMLDALKVSMLVDKEETDINAGSYPVSGWVANVLNDPSKKVALILCMEGESD